jgi:recombinational DNA repair ATPase RecF
VQDNLNTHNPGSFYALLPPQQAYALGQRFEMIYTPTKASWLNMVEIEFSALSRQCLNRRIGHIEILAQEVKAWVAERNQKQIKVHWQFTIDNAREKFKNHYPELS